MHDQPARESVARHFHEHQLGAPLEALMHEDAVMALFVNHLRWIRGRANILAAVGNGRASEAYRAAVRSFEWLADDTLLVSGWVRHALERGGFSEGSVWWLDEQRIHQITRKDHDASCTDNPGPRRRHRHRQRNRRQ